MFCIFFSKKVFVLVFHGKGNPSVTYNDCLLLLRGGTLAGGGLLPQLKEVRGALGWRASGSCRNTPRWEDLLPLMPPQGDVHLVYVPGMQEPFLLLLPLMPPDLSFNIDRVSKK